MFTFTKIADFETSIPAKASIPRIQSSFNYFSRSFKNLLNKQNQIQEAQNNFAQFSAPAITENRIVFAGSPSNPYREDTKRYQEGIYVYKNGVLEVIVDAQTSVPHQDTTFGGFHTALAVNAEAIAFVGVSQEGYPVPEFPSRLSPDPYALDMGMIVPDKPVEPFLKDWGIYLYHRGALQVVVDVNTPMPNTNLKFGFFGIPCLIGKDIVFWGKSALPDGCIPEAY